MLKSNRKPLLAEIKSLRGALDALRLQQLNFVREMFGEMETLEQGVQALRERCKHSDLQVALDKAKYETCRDPQQMNSVSSATSFLWTCATKFIRS